MTLLGQGGRMDEEEVGRSAGVRPETGEGTARERSGHRGKPGGPLLHLGSRNFMPHCHQRGEMKQRRDLWTHTGRSMLGLPPSGSTHNKNPQCLVDPEAQAQAQGSHCRNTVVAARERHMHFATF